MAVASRSLAMEGRLVATITASRDVRMPPAQRVVMVRTMSRFGALLAVGSGTTSSGSMAVGLSSAETADGGSLF